MGFSVSPRCMASGFICLASWILLFYSHTRMLSYSFQCPISHTRAADLHVELYKYLKFDSIAGCAGEGNDPELCNECSQRFTSSYPLTIDDVQRSLVPGNFCNFRHIADKVRSAEPLHIYVVGGSMTAGHGCVDGNRQDATCAWPSRLKSKLSAYFNASEVHVHNVARPGWDYGTFVENPDAIEELVEADVVIVDLVVNSQAYGAEDLEKHMTDVDAFLSYLTRPTLSGASRWNSHAILFVETFRTCAFSDLDCNYHCAPEQQGHTVCDLAGQPRTYSWCNRWWYMADLEIPIIKHYQIPVVHFRDAVWPTISQPSRFLPCIWNGLSHPDAVAHELMASLIAYGLAYITLQSEIVVNCPLNGHPPLPTPPFHQQLETKRFCSSTPESLRMRADMPESFQPLGSMGWWLREDVIGKPGWLYEGGNSTDPEMAVIWFKVRFSVSPQLEVTFLRTYEKIGRVQMLIGPENMTKTSLHQAFKTYTLDGYHQNHISVPYMQIFVHSENKATGGGCDLLPRQVGVGPFVIAFRPLESSRNSKFKLISLSSC